jgi:NAD(P)-dependent dehydrogenase (short-subunit alcohol dehydrogenase family)
MLDYPGVIVMREQLIGNAIITKGYCATHADCVCHAGMAYKGNVFGAEEAQTTLDTNFAGTRAVCERLAPLLADGGRVVNVCSSAGKLRILRSQVRWSGWQCCKCL